MSLPPSAQGSIPGGVASPLPVRDFHPLEAPDFPWRTNEIIEVLATPYLNVLPLRIFPPQKPRGHVALLKAIERYLARPPRQMPRKSFAEECLSSGNTAIGTEQKIERFVVLVDSAVEKVPLATDLDVGLVHPPGRIHGSGEAGPSLLELRHRAHPQVADCLCDTVMPRSAIMATRSR